MLPMFIAASLPIILALQVHLDVMPGLAQAVAQASETESAAIADLGALVAKLPEHKISGRLVAVLSMRAVLVMMVCWFHGRHAQ